MQRESCQTQIAENLRYLRTVFGYTQSDIAGAIHVCRCTYVQYESGRKLPPTETILALARFYSISVDVLLENGCRKFARGILQADRARIEFSQLLSIFLQLSDMQLQSLLQKARFLLSREEQAT